jgi:predicted nucleic acid-binding protein
VRHDAELALPTVTIAEIAFGIKRSIRIRGRLGWEQGLTDWRHRFADRIFGFTEAAALAYGDIMSAAVQKGRPMTAPTE